VAAKTKGKFKFYRINQNIRSPKLRVIGQEGKQLGVLTLPKALEEAEKLGVDLVEVAPTVNPPVAKLVDFKKFRYQEAKKIKKEKKKSGGELKTIRVSPFIALADLNLKVKRAREFLKEGNKVKIEVKFYGRLLTKKDFGYKILKEFVSQLGEEAKTEQEPKWLGKRLMMTLVAGQGEKNEKKEDKNENQKVSSSEIQVDENRESSSSVFTQSPPSVKEEKGN
jgi:translation initiation factor IF-3